MSAWDELREAWHYNTPIYRMSSESRWLYFGLLSGFLLLLFGLAALAVAL